MGGCRHSEGRRRGTCAEGQHEGKKGKDELGEAGWQGWAADHGLRRPAARAAPLFRAEGRRKRILWVDLDAKRKDARVFL